jgi:hypothetical protein
MFEDILNERKEPTKEEFKYLYCRICIDLEDCRTDYIDHCMGKDPEKLKMYMRGEHV